MGKEKSGREGPEPDMAQHIQRNCQHQEFSAGAVTVRLPVPAFKSPGSRFNPVCIGTSRTLLKDRVKSEKGKKQDPRFRVGWFGVFLS